MSVAVSELFGRIASSSHDGGRRDLLLYLHIPFCRYRCTFCDWVERVPARELISADDFHARYVDALCRQIREVAPRLAAMGYTARLLYWGGGTPTALDPRHYATIMRALGDSIDLSGVVEHSLEATPDTVTEERIAALAAVGVGRISVGVQSMDPDQLRKSGRGHSPDCVRDAARILRNAGIDNYNFDVLVGLPDQTNADTEDMIQGCLELEPAHMTLYAYRPTATTQLAMTIRKGRRSAPSNATLTESFVHAQDLLTRAGYAEYITGYFARSPERRFRGEQHYFGLEGDFFGFGAGANSFIAHHQLETRSDSVSAFIDDPLLFTRCDRFSIDLIGPILLRLRTCILTEDGIGYDRFRGVFGFEFAEVREHPLFKGYVDYFRACGADFIDDGERLYLRPDTRTSAHLLSYGRSVEYQRVVAGA